MDDKVIAKEIVAAMIENKYLIFNHGDNSKRIETVGQAFVTIYEYVKNVDCNTKSD